MTQSTNAFMEANIMYSTRAIEGISSCAVHLANGRVVPLIPRDPTLPPAHRISASAEIRMYPFNTSPLFFLLLTDFYFSTSTPNGIHRRARAPDRVDAGPDLALRRSLFARPPLCTPMVCIITLPHFKSNLPNLSHYTCSTQYNIFLVRLILWKECLCCLDPCSPRDCGR